MRYVQVLVLVVGIAATSPSVAQDSTVRVFDSSLNKLADRVQPVTSRGMHRASMFVFGSEVTLCYSPYSATVTQLRFTTSPANVQITGRVDARWCNLNFSSALSTTADVTYDAGQRAIVVRIGPTNVQPRFNILGLNFALPISINVAPSLTIPPLPVGVAQIGFQGVRGPVTLRFQPQNVSLVRRSGYLQLQSDIAIW